MKHIYLIAACLWTFGGYGQSSTAQKSLDIYGHVMTDIGYDFKRVNPSWFDVMRPSKLPAAKGGNGPDGNMYFSVRQTRFGVKGYLPTSLGELKTQFEFEMFGTGADAGRTAFRLRHAYGELGKFGVGQTNSPFMDGDVFPNSLEYWGPNGMVFFRNVQIRFMPIKGETRLTIALEQPGASSDQGNYADRIKLQNVQGRFNLPDLSAEYHVAQPWGYVELAGILRKIAWKDQLADGINLNGSVLGWGLNLSSNINIEKDVIRMQVVYGEGIQNYMNDAPADIGIRNQFSNRTSPIKGVALPVLGLVAFLDHYWNNKFTSAVGFSSMHIDNSNGQNQDAYKSGQYALANLIYYPAPNFLLGAELQYGARQNYADGWKTNDLKLQFSFKYNFSETFHHKNKD
ncbi:hypothetical protein SAMN05444008_104100 [Cnuella takakiae]|uniref:Porin subfamily protein n=1 Tax=Cnuella takakiae TaxID=1302690 RepID=A0A1M4Y056_9BACT|nr:DcaP family trimeric outer membrane transporter [Cnuella takakiae]OLY93000.1 hypothetical protein BUE76_14675 [Cnuella takakiae]SHE98953.1 hypothetical protein SAMN05444008_104100 [Cnuella takakiae]